jgi:hypothetical protein
MADSEKFPEEARPIERDPADLGEDLPPERIAEVERFLADKWGKCPMCGGGQWTVSQRLLPLPAGGKASFIVVPILCGECSFSAMVNLMHAKLLST